MEAIKKKIAQLRIENDATNAKLESVEKEKKDANARADDVS